MKRIIIQIIIVLLIAANSWAVVVTGTGATKEEAINNGLRDAVEMFTSNFVYGVTDVENYQIKKDQIVAASSGYVKQYRIIKTERQDSYYVITMDVKLSEEKIETILRDNVQIVTVEDVLKDYSNVSQRQDQMRKLMEMLNILAERPVREKYQVAYTGYEIKRITPSKVDLVIKTKIYANPFFLKTSREIIKNLSNPSGDAPDLNVVRTSYRYNKKQLVFDRYYIPENSNFSAFEISAAMTINGNKAEQCHDFADNAMIIYDYGKMARGAISMLFKGINENKNYSTIQNSKVIPPEGLAYNINYSTSNVEEIKQLTQMKVELVSCKELKEIEQVKPLHNYPDRPVMNDR